MAPKYMALYRTLKNEIQEGKYIPPKKLPTEAELMERFSVSRTTVRRATGLLRTERLIQSRSGFGTEATVEKAVPLHNRSSRITGVTGVEFNYTMSGIESERSSEALISIVPANSTVGAALNLNLAEPVFRIRWLHYVNELPFLYLTNYVRCDLSPNLDQFASQLVSLYPLLEQQYGIHFTRAVEHIEPMVATFYESRMLGVAEGVPLTKLCRTAWCTEGPMEYSESVINPALLRISLNIFRIGESEGHNMPVAL